MNGTMTAPQLTDTLARRQPDTAILRVKRQYEGSSLIPADEGKNQHGRPPASAMSIPINTVHPLRPLHNPMIPLPAPTKYKITRPLPRLPAPYPTDVTSIDGSVLRSCYPSLPAGHYLLRKPGAVIRVGPMRPLPSTPMPVTGNEPAIFTSTNNQLNANTGVDIPLNTTEEIYNPRMTLSSNVTIFNKRHAKVHGATESKKGGKENASESAQRQERRVKGPRPLVI